MTPKKPRKPPRKKLVLKVAKDDPLVAYLKLPAHPTKVIAGYVKRSLRVSDFIEYSGPDLILDFDKNNELIGVEILGT